METLKPVNVFADAKIVDIYPTESHFVEITPELADKLIYRSQCYFANRKLQAKDVKRYAIDIANGNWEPNGENIIMDPYGRCLNGQHRLHAISQAKKSAVIMVTQGIDQKYFGSMDSGRNRTAAEVFAIHGINNASLASKICVATIALADGYAIAGGDGNTNTRNSVKHGNKNLEAIRYYKDHTSIINKITSYICRLEKQRKEMRTAMGITITNIGAYILYNVIYNHHPLDECTAFWDEFFALTPVDKPIAGIIKRVVEALRRANLAKETNLRPITKQNYIAFAWNNWLLKKNPRSLPTFGDKNEKITFN